MSSETGASVLVSGGALAPAPPLLGWSLAPSGHFPSEGPSGGEVRVPESGEGSYTCFGKCRAGRTPRGIPDALTVSFIERLVSPRASVLRSRVPHR